MLLQQLLNGVVLSGMYALIALGFTMMFGIAGIGNFAHGAVLMWAAYLVTVAVAMQLNFFLAVVLVAVVVGFFGLVSERVVFEPVLKRPMAHTFLVSVGLMFVLNNLILVVFGAQVKSIPSPVSGVVQAAGLILSWQRIMVLAITILLILALYLFLQYTRIGRAIRAVSQDVDGALVVGVNLRQVNGAIFLISAALAGVSGALYGSMFGVEPNMGFLPLIKAFAIVVVGGLGSVPGAVVGALVIGLSEALAVAYLPSGAYAQAFGFVFMIVILLVRPSGLLGQRD